MLGGKGKVSNTEEGVGASGEDLDFVLASGERKIDRGSYSFPYPVALAFFDAFTPIDGV